MNKYIADDGYVWKNKTNGTILNNVIYLGKNDDIFNYEQIIKPIEETEQI